MVARFLLPLLLLTGCSAFEGAPDGSPLLGLWQFSLAHIDGEAVEANDLPGSFAITFGEAQGLTPEGSRVWGHSACNTFQGTYRTSRGSLVRIFHIRSTLIHCGRANALVEGALFKGLQGGGTFSRSGEALRVEFSGGWLVFEAVSGGGA